MPRLALKMGSRNVVEDRQKKAEEEEQEKTILDKIKTLRRLAGKRNALRIEPKNLNMEDKRKPANEDDEKNEKDNPKAKKRRKAFQQDIGMFVKPANESDSIFIENVASNENDRFQKAQNNIINKIDCRITHPRLQGLQITRIM